MASLDASPINIILTVAVVGLIGFFIILLMKLNPSVETKRKPETEDRETERPRQYQPPSLPVVEHVPSQPRPQAKTEPPTTTQKPLVILNSVAGSSNTQTGYETARQTPSPVQPISTPTKTSPPPGNMFTPSKRDCIHHFGYLRTFPKNSPIPQECFGCEKIVDCLVTKKTGRK